MASPSLRRGFRLRHAFVRWASTLVMAEHGPLGLQPCTRNTLSAASQLKADGITVLLAGAGDSLRRAAVSLQGVPGVTKILLADDTKLSHGLAEPLADLVASLHAQSPYGHILAPSSSFGKNVLPRVAALLGASPVTDVMRIVDDRTFVRPIYAGNALETVQVLGSSPRLLTVRPTAFPAAATPTGTDTGAVAVAVEEVSVDAAVQGGGTNASAPGGGASSSACWVSDQVKASDRPELGSARVVVSGGRGMKGAEHFQMLEKLADRLGGGAVGASRAAVDAGMVANDLQV
eukprot:jgi/Mesvir1/24647/Mv21953-RA.1